MRINRGLIHSTVCLSLFISCSCGVLTAQSPTLKPAPLFSSDVDGNPFADVSVTIAAVPNGAYNRALLAVFASDTSLSYAVSVNATQVIYASFSTGMPGMNCSPSTLITCTASIKVFKDKIYIAYVDKETRGLDVVVAEPIPGQPNYNFHLVHQDTSFAMLGSPTMTDYHGYLAIYFRAQTEQIPSALYGVGFNGTTWLNMREIAAF